MQFFCKLVQFKSLLFIKKNHQLYELLLLRPIMTSGGFLSDTSMKFLRRSHTLTGVRKTAHARRNGFILTEFPHAIFV